MAVGRWMWTARGRAPWDSLPEPPVMEKLSRYEAHIDRSLFKTLHELQRLQAARRGDAVPAPVVVDVDVTGVADVG